MDLCRYIRPYVIVKLREGSFQLSFQLTISSSVAVAFTVNVSLLTLAVVALAVAPLNGRYMSRYV